MFMDVSLKVLIAEDDKDLLEFLVTYFRKRGIFNVFEAENGKKVFDIFASETIDIILCDWNMPEISGIEVLETLRGLNIKYKDIPFIMLTSLRDKNRVVRALKASVDDYITKPFRIKALEERLDQILLKKLFNDYVSLCFMEIEKYNFRVANKKLLAAYKIKPKDIKTLCGLVISSVCLNEQDRAKSYFSLIENDSSLIYFYAKALVHYMNKEVSAAVDDLQVCITMDSNCIKPYLKLSEIFISTKEFDSAQRVLTSLENIEVKQLKDLEIIREQYKVIDAGSEMYREKILEYTKLIKNFKPPVGNL